MVTGFHCSFWHEGCSMEKNKPLVRDAAENVRLKDARPHRHHSARRFCFAADCQLIAEQKNRVERAWCHLRIAPSFFRRQHVSSKEYAKAFPAPGIDRELALRSASP